MLILVSGATRTAQRLSRRETLGALLTPDTGNAVARIVAAHKPWAADNGCFLRFNEPAYRRMLARISGQPLLLWVTAPDVVGNAPATLALFATWRPILEAAGLPIAFVAQDGQESWPVPWDAIHCLFIGGSTSWKEGRYAAGLIAEAKRQGIWVHIGRVNTRRRERYFAALRADSFDGTKYSRFAETYLPAATERLAARQSGLFSTLDNKVMDTACCCAWGDLEYLDPGEQREAQALLDQQICPACFAPL
jgi:hypothetical protein